MPLIDIKEDIKRVHTRVRMSIALQKIIYHFFLFLTFGVFFQFFEGHFYNCKSYFQKHHLHFIVKKKVFHNGIAYCTVQDYSALHLIRASQLRSLLFECIADMDTLNI